MEALLYLCSNTSLRTSEENLLLSLLYIRRCAKNLTTKFKTNCLFVTLVVLIHLNGFDGVEFDQTRIRGRQSLTAADERKRRRKICSFLPPHPVGSLRITVCNDSSLQKRLAAAANL